MKEKQWDKDSLVSCEARQSGVLSLLPAMVKVVRNGIKTTGRQNGKCKVCNRQFQSKYLYRSADKRVKDQLILMQLRGSGVTETAIVSGVSPATVLRCLITESSEAAIRLKHHRYDKVQIAELGM